MPTESPNTMVISPELLQAISVNFEPAERRSMERAIQTVGRVEVDERQIARVTIKLEGWVARLYVLEGLKEGEHVVTSANFLIDSESQLKAAVEGMAGMRH